MSRLVPALTRAFDILELFLTERDPLSVPEIAERVRLPRSTAHELVRTLVARHYLAPAPGQAHRFNLGSKSFELGNAYASRIDLVVEGRDVAQRVSDASEETVHVAILDQIEVIYIAKVDSSQTVRMVSGVGRHLPAHCTGVGKMLLASLSDDEIRTRYGEAPVLRAFTPNTITSLDQLFSELAEIRVRGLAFDNCESNAAVRCVAAPVYDHTGKTVAAMSISVPIFRDLPERRQALVDLLIDGTGELSRRLGYRGREGGQMGSTA